MKFSQIKNLLTTKKILTRVAQGLLTLLPICITLYVLFWLVSTIEIALTPIIPDPIYFPGMGMLAGLVILFFVGLIVNAYVVRTVLAWSGSLIERVPLVKTVYGALQDAVNLVTIGKEKKMESVVSVEISESIHLIGFVTSHESAKEIFSDREKLGVYIPFSYQIGGYTLYIDREKVTPLDIDVETAMRIALTGGTMAPPNTDMPQTTSIKP